MTAVVITLLCLALCAAVFLWLRAEKRAEGLTAERDSFEAAHAGKCADYEILNQQCAERGIELFKTRNVAHLLSKSLRVFVSDMDAMSVKLGDPLMALKDEREALRLHDELIQPETPCPKN